jgi:hypothetical protein
MKRWALTLCVRVVQQHSLDEIGRTDNGNMSLPPDVEAAKDRMERAQAVLLADVENSDGTDTARREELVNELQRATDAYMEKVGGLR